MASEYKHPKLGIIRLQRRVGCKRISISVGRSGRISVTHPWYVSRRAALAFVEQKAEWIMSARQRVQQAVKPSLIGEGYRTRSHTLRVDCNAPKCGYMISNSEVLVCLVSDVAADSEQGQQVIRTALTEALRAEAHKVLPEMVERLARQHGLSYNGITIKNIRSKWGSCSAVNHLNFSLYLMLLPNELVEMVVLHELCHTVHKNHSAEFHTLLNSLLGGRERELNLALRKYRTSL